MSIMPSAYSNNFHVSLKLIEDKTHIIYLIQTVLKRACPLSEFIIVPRSELI